MAESRTPKQQCDDNHAKLMKLLADIEGKIKQLPSTTALFLACYFCGTSIVLGTIVILWWLA